MSPGVVLVLGPLAASGCEGSSLEPQPSAKLDSSVARSAHPSADLRRT
jgi:hypothetical protein